MALEADAGRLGQSPKLGIRRALFALAGLLLVVAIFIGVKVLGGDEDKKSGEITGSGGDSFTLSYPKSWLALSGKQLSKLPGPPLAVVRRKDGKGFVILRKEKRAPKNFNAFSADLTKALDKRVPDFEKRSSKLVQIAAGKAFFFSYIRKTTGTVHTIVLVPAGKRSYVLNTVSSGKSNRVAREVARIILSFKA
jgi:hypothetical protein